MRDDRQPEPGVAALARARLGHPVEALGDPRKVGRGNADSRVGYSQTGGIALNAGSDSHPPPLGGELDGIIDQVDQDLDQSVAISEHQGETRRHLGGERDPFRVGLGPHDRQHSLQHVPKRDRLKLQAGLSQLDI